MSTDSNPPNSLTVFLKDSAFAEMMIQARHPQPFQEVGGHLVGYYGIWEGRRYIDIQRIIPAQSESSSQAHFAFTHAIQRNARSILTTWNRADPYLRNLGWYHSHPHWFGIRLSSDDHHGLVSFPEPHQVAIIVEPRGPRIGTKYRQQIGVFVWDAPGEISGEGSVPHDVIIYAEREYHRNPWY
jgi:proteasome lid subunit RPN8/RPN11